MDPRWLEILKASGWQLFAISLALNGFWLLIRLEIVPKIQNEWLIYGLPLAILITGCLALVCALESGLNFLKRALAVRKKAKEKQEKLNEDRRKFSEYIPHLVDFEWRILAYLYQENRRTFTASVDGDLASTLYNQGFIEMVARPGQQVSVLDVTFRVPDAVWQVMNDNEDKFKEPRVKLGYRGKLPWHSGY